MKTDEAFIQGFISKCAQSGIDPEKLLKYAGYYQYRLPDGRLVTGTANGGESYPAYTQRDVNRQVQGRYVVGANRGRTLRDNTTTVNSNIAKYKAPPVQAGTVAGRGVPDSAVTSMEMPPFGQTTAPTTVAQRSAPPQQQPPPTVATTAVARR